MVAANHKKGCGRFFSLEGRKNSSAGACRMGRGARTRPSEQIIVLDLGDAIRFCISQNAPVLPCASVVVQPVSQLMRCIAKFPSSTVKSLASSGI